MKISRIQLFWMLFSMEIGMTTLLTIGPTFKEAKQGAWLAMLLAAFASLFITYIATQLSLLYPRQTLVEFAPKIIGRWLGRLIVFTYLLVWYTVAGLILREYADFVHLALFSSTPLWVIILLMLLVMIYAVYGGIHIVGRCSEIIGPFILLSIIMITILSFPDLKFMRLLPLLHSNGVMPIIKGSLGATSFMGESIMIMMLIAFVSDKSKVNPPILWGVGLASLFLVSGTMNVLMVLGKEVPAKLPYPIYTFIQYTSVMEFIQNIDVLAVIVTIFSIFIKLCLYMFLTSYGMAQLFQIKNWRKVVWGSALLIFVISILPRNMVESQVIFPEIWKNYVLPIYILGIPLMLWLIGAVRRKFS